MKNYKIKRINEIGIWFNNEKKEEYIVTPKYLIIDPNNVIKNGSKKYLHSKDNQTIKECISNENRLTYWKAMSTFPFIENIGEFLLQFLNTNFKNFEEAYDNFYCFYGIELLYAYSNLEKLGKEISVDELKNFHNSIVEKIISIQNDFKETIDFIFNLNQNEGYEQYNFETKFVACIMKHKTNLYKYTENTKIVNYIYDKKMDIYENVNFDEILEILSLEKALLQVSNFYMSNHLGDICFCVLNQVIQNNLVIKTCQHCGRYFIPNKSNEIYCDRVYEDGRTCRELGALETYKKNLESNSGLLEYRRIYNKMSNRITRNKDNKNLKKEFDIWKKNAQTEIKKFKKDEITEKELYEWMIENE